MLKRILKWVGITAALITVVGAILHFGFGLQPVVYGGGRVGLAFVDSAESQASTVEEHRQAQRQQEPATPATAPEPTATPETATASAAAPTNNWTPDWAFFRGPRWDGHYTARPLNVAWGTRPLTPVWKQPVGGGYASFVTARLGDLSLAFTIEQRGRQEVVAAYDVATGRERWTAKWDAEFKEFMGGDGPRATPTFHDGRLYALGAEGELRALDAATGATLWRTNILSDAGASNLQWGMSASPLIVDDTVVTIPGGSRGRSLIAYNRLTGARAWSAGDDGQSYSSPMLVTLDGVRQILNVSAKRIMGLNPANGAVLWEFPWVTMYDVNAGQPIVIGDNRVFMSSGYDHGAVVLEIDMNGTRGSVKEIWQNNRMKNQFASSHFHNGFIYGLDDGILACVDANTGERKWKAGRYGHGQTVLVDGHLIIATEEGDVALVRATPDKHDELARFPVLDGKTWNHPAFSDGRLLVRNISTMAMFDLRR